MNQNPSTGTESIDITAHGVHVPIPLTDQSVGSAGSTNPFAAFVPYAQSVTIRDQEVTTHPLMVKRIAYLLSLWYADPAHRRKQDGPHRTRYVYGTRDG